VNKKRLIPSLLLSFLIHLMLLTVIDMYFVPTPVLPEWPELIPVDMVIIEDEDGKGRYESVPTLKDAGFTKDALVAKAQPARGTPSTSSVEDFPGPIPREGTFRPSLSAEQIPTPGVLPPGQEGKEVRSKRVTSRSPSSPQRLPEIHHSPSDQSPLLEVVESRVPTLAEQGGIPKDSTTLKEVTAPLGRNRPRPESLSDLLPIPTVRSPLLPEEGEMIPGGQERTTQSSSRYKTEPFLSGFEKRGTFVASRKGYSMLFVVDTSGSVKGPPLEGIKKSAMEFVSLLREVDRCAVITFDDEARLVIPFTADKGRLSQEIANLTTRGRNTVLFDALDLAFSHLREEKERGRFVVLFSDGKDEGSQSDPLGVINRARKSQVVVFCLGYSRVEKRYLQTLEGISQSTGGIFAEAPLFGEIVELFRTARDVKGKKAS